MERIQEIFQKFNISCFVDYYHVFDKNKESRSNQEIIQAFKDNNETWTDNACATRASIGKRIFIEGLEIDALRYVINSANENKVKPNTKEKALKIYSSILNIDIDPNLFTNNNEPFAVDKRILNEELRIVEKQKLFSKEEKKALIKIRLGQSYYRNELINLWRGCSVTSCKNTNVLIASHIKAYKHCEGQEHYDKYNGLLLSPCYDRLFDLHLISFTETGEIMISKTLSDDDLNALKISRTDKLVKVFPENQKYLKHHRTEFLKNQANE